ncbi:MAG: hypothetical protein H0U71_03140 [Gammaproteobacteria bacterium]|nr:hypothetical protein [Gammaproteobacteria bacterium]
MGKTFKRDDTVRSSGIGKVFYEKKSLVGALIEIMARDLFITHDGDNNNHQPNVLGGDNNNHQHNVQEERINQRLEG